MCLDWSVETNKNSLCAVKNVDQHFYVKMFEMPLMLLIKNINSKVSLHGDKANEK